MSDLGLSDIPTKELLQDLGEAHRDALACQLAINGGTLYDKHGDSFEERRNQNEFVIMLINMEITQRCFAHSPS